MMKHLVPPQPNPLLKFEDFFKYQLYNNVDEMKKIKYILCSNTHTSGKRRFLY